MGLWRSTTVAPDDERPNDEPLLRLELNVRAAQSLRDAALTAYSIARQRNPYDQNLATILSDALLEIDRRLEQGLVSAGLAPTRDGGKT
jgi:hypothetical protein